MKKILTLLLLLFPWRIRRPLMVALFGYKIHPTARIGFSFVCPEHLEMEAGARINSLTVCKEVVLLKMGEQSSIGSFNWVSGFPISNKTSFSDQRDRRPELVIGEHSAITDRHLIDCTDSVRVGRFTTVAGRRSQILTHSIDLYRCRQASRPVVIGDYCFVGSGCVLLAGSALPSYSVLGALSLLNKAYETTHRLYAGTPARPVKTLEKDMKYFVREIGYVY
jgi:acetyltransferase-like isoleucine patch superfamily enzyme